MVQAKNQIDFASQNGIPFVRVLLTLDPNRYRQICLRQKSRYEQLCSYAANKNVRVLVESCGLLSDSASWQPLLPMPARRAAACCGIFSIHSATAQKNQSRR